jgi:hypothetical protein
MVMKAAVAIVYGRSKRGRRVSTLSCRETKMEIPGDMNNRTSSCSRVHGKGTTGIAMKAVLPLLALCVICLGLSAPPACAGTFSATAIWGPTEPFCGEFGGFPEGGAGGSGFASVSLGPTGCAYEDQLSL